MVNWKSDKYFTRDFKDIDLYKYRQLLGEVSPQEVAEAEKVAGGSYCLSRAKSEPAKIKAYSWAWTPLLAAGLGLNLYGLFYLKASRYIWTWCGFLPALTYLLYTKARQP